MKYIIYLNHSSININNSYYKIQNQNLETNKYFFEINLKKKQTQKINTPKINIINNQGDISILFKN